MVMVLTHRVEAETKHIMPRLPDDSLFKVYPENSFRQVAVIFFGYLSLISGSVKHRRVVVDVVDVNHDGRVILVQIVRGYQTQLILRLLCFILHVLQS